jgi:hypothetical protein
VNHASLFLPRAFTFSPCGRAATDHILFQVANGSLVFFSNSF